MYILKQQLRGQRLHSSSIKLFIGSATFTMMSSKKQNKVQVRNEQRSHVCAKLVRVSNDRSSIPRYVDPRRSTQLTLYDVSNKCL